MLSEHEKSTARIQTNFDWWTSNSILIVDTSRSMRASDVWGMWTQLGAVWMSIALDFLANCLESGEGGSSEVVSVVTLAETPKVVIQEQPSTWVLYNKMVAIYNQETVYPCSHGPFLKCVTFTICVAPVWRNLHFSAFELRQLGAA